METLLYLFLLVLPTVTVFTLLKAIKIIVIKDDKAKFNIYAIIASVSCTLVCLAVAYF